MAKGIATVAALGEQHRSQHSIGNRHVHTQDFGLLKPVKTLEVVPGDIVSLDIKSYLKLAPNAAPIIGDIEVSLHAFFVPYRILFNPFNEYVTGLKDIDLPYVGLSTLTGTVNTSSGEHVVPSYSTKAFRNVLSGLGVNPKIVYARSVAGGGVSNDINISPFPFMAYERIWFDWFSNKQFIDSSQISAYGLDVNNSVVSGENPDANFWVRRYFAPRYRCFGKDFITSALVSPAGLDSTGKNLSVGAASGERGEGVRNNFSDIYANSYDQFGTGGEDALSIPQLRTAVAMQKWLEKANFIGKQTISRIKGMFGGNATPERLQMSEFIGSSSSIINFENHTASVGTAEDDTEVNAFGAENRAAKSMLGQQYSQGDGSVTLNTSPYHVQEHGLIMVIQSILPRPQYYQSLPRLFTRGVSLPDASRFDFYHPEFENIGFQPIYKHEVVNPVSDITNHTQRGISDPFKIWGWQPKYEDYKYSMDVISGDFLENDTAMSMQQFHLGRDLLRQFGIIRQDGTLDPSRSSGNLDSITMQFSATCDEKARQAFDDKFVVPSSTVDHFVCDTKIGVNASRPMQSVALPSLDGEKHDGSPIALGGVRL